MWENFLVWMSKNRCKNPHLVWLWAITDAYIGLKKGKKSVSFCIHTGDKEH